MTTDEEIFNKMNPKYDELFPNPKYRHLKNEVLKMMKLAREDVLKITTHTYKDTMIAQREAELEEKNKEIQKLKEQLSKNCHHNCREAVESETEKLRDALYSISEAGTVGCVNCEDHERKAKKALEG